MHAAPDVSARPHRPAGEDYRALVAVTTCQRPAYLGRHLPHLARHCTTDPRFSLLVSLDGTEPEVVRLCEEWSVPLLYSDQREGVGLAKNRVLERFPDFDYYFFLEDDVEVVHGSVFPAHVQLFEETGIHHFSLFVADGARKVISESAAAGQRVLHCLYGGADFNFFTGRGLAQVGGWHPMFARYRRFGHTEHSYRFARAGLAPAPFNVAVSLSKECIWHVPPAVTTVSRMSYDEDQVALPERELMERELEHVPLETLSSYRFNDAPFGALGRLAATLTNGERYPLVERTERRHAWSDYQLWRAEAGPAHRRVGALLQAVWNWPANPALRHKVKMAISG